MEKVSSWEKGRPDERRTNFYFPIKYFEMYKKSSGFSGSMQTKNQENFFEVFSQKVRYNSEHLNYFNL